MTTTFESLSAGDGIEGPTFAVSRESIRLFCDASLDYNPLHLDDDYMKGNFGKTNFGGIIMHGMNNFGLISRMLTDWAYPAGAIHRRLETRWVKPVRPGDTIQPTGIIKSKQVTKNSRWVLIDVMVKNQGARRWPPARRWSNSRPKRRRGHSSGTPVAPRVVTRPPVDRATRCARGATTSLARPSQARKRMVSQVLSISHQRWPCRAERGSAWWLLCQPSPLEISPMRRLLRLSSSVS